MKKCVLCILAAFLICPMSCFAWDIATLCVDDYVEELNGQCPISFPDKDWGVNSFTMVGDRYVLVDIQVPSVLTMFLSSLTGDADNVKQLWIRQLDGYGEPWTGFVERMVAAMLPVVINVHPCDSDDSALMTLTPSDFLKE